MFDFTILVLCIACSLSTVVLCNFCGFVYCYLGAWLFYVSLVVGLLRLVAKFLSFGFRCEVVLVYLRWVC